jgi:hypothetical protein
MRRYHSQGRRICCKYVLDAQGRQGDVLPRAKGGKRPEKGQIAVLGRESGGGNPIHA